MSELVGRIITSQKTVYAMIPVLTNVIANLFGVDVSQPAVLVLDAAFALLFLGQWVLDLRWGSRSDRTGAFNPNS